MLLNFTNDNLTEYIKKENNIISNAMSFLIKNEDTLLSYMNILPNEKIDIAKSLVKKLNKNLNDLDELRNILRKFSSSNSEISDINIENYNSSFSHAFNQMFEITSSIEVLLQNIIKTNNIENINKLEQNNLEDNTTLLISEKDNKVYLPYKKKDIENILLFSEKYSTLEDVINDLYTVPLSKYTHSASARFREGFNLMRKKESASFFKAVDLGLELFSKYDLNPAIITACENLDELDIYLDYLETDNLDKFHIFNIKYEINPAIQKESNNKNENF